MRIEEIISTDHLHRLRSVSESYGPRYRSVQDSKYVSPGILPSLLQFTKQRFGRLIGISEHDVELCVHHSNSWTIMSDRFVLRLGDAVRLDADQERRFWEIGRLCGAITPNLIEVGSFGGQPYMIYGLVAGDPVLPGHLPAEAGRFLRRLHSIEVSEGASPVRGNWPTRRDARYVTALAFAERRFGQGVPIVHALRRAARDAHTRGMVLNHGDFRTANMLMTPDKKLAVLDWTDAHLGTREEDIGGCDPEDIPGLITHYCTESGIVLDTGLVAGHAFARVLSLIAHQVLSETVLDPVYQVLSPLLSAP